ncbi:MAG: FAD-dependent oxidoreductase [Hyphomicrobiales bacterium]|nr:FAD-dependent oxidoreductase [Hyphomicrobiales bacterium]
MTKQVRIIVIGGGIVGCSILYHLAKAGCKDALLIERKELTAGATWHAAGNVHTQSGFPNLSTLQAYSLRLYGGLAEEVGQEVGSHVVGGFFLAQTKERLKEFKFLAGKFKAIGIEYDLVTPDEIKEKYPLINTDDLVGGAWDPDEGYVDPYSVTMGLAAGARQMGGKIVRNTQITSIDRLPSGHWQLSTDTGEIYECETIVNAGGFWANEIANMVGTRVPITNMEHHYLITETMAEVEAHHEELPMIRDTDAQFYLRQEGQGLLLGPWERDCQAAWDNKGAPWNFGQELLPDNLDRLEDGLAAIYHRVPALERAGIKRVVNGAISFAPDARPMIGPMPGVPNFFVACGFLGGIAQAGGIGLAMSQWILEGEPELDLSFIDVARFGDWTTKEFARERTYEVFPVRYEIIYPQLERASGRPLKTSPIYSELVKRGAVMGQAYGWERPLWYAPKGVEAVDQPSFSHPNWWQHVGNEARNLHENAGLLEMSSYGKFIVEGPDAATFLDKITTNRLPVDNKLSLSLLLNDRGSIVGDVTIARLCDNRFYLVGATLGVAIYQRWMEQHVGDLDVNIQDITNTTAVLGIMGPNSRALLETISHDDFSSEAFGFMSWNDIEIGRVKCRALRVSFSGELGFELHCSMENQLALFEALMGAGSTCGLGLVGARALGQLRLEKGYRSWGTEMTTEVSPASAGLDRFCRPEKGDFIGRDAVLAARKTPPEKVIATLAFAANGSDCWGSEPIFADEECVGYVTSGGYGWRVEQSLAVGWIPRSCCKPGTKLQIQILCEMINAEVVADPIFDPENKRLLS